MATCECGCGTPTTRVRQREGEYAAGQYRRFARGHWKRKLLPPSKTYAETSVEGRRVLVHRLRAERALGKPLPPGAVVHHADGSISPDAPLVICQDEAYHRLLHIRTRVVRAGGDPNADRICSHCKQVKPMAGFDRDRTRPIDGLYRWCKECRKH
jgi:hypothetical protein